MLTVVAGPPCAGKTTYARAHFARIFEFDEWVVARSGMPYRHAMRFYKMGYALARPDYLGSVCRACAAGGDLALTDFFVLRADRLDALAYFRSRCIRPINIVWLDVPLEEILRRNALRPQPAPVRALERFYASMQPPGADEGWDSIRILPFQR